MICLVCACVCEHITVTIVGVQDARVEAGLSCAYRSMDWTLGPVSQVFEGDDGRGEQLSLFTTAVIPHPMPVPSQAPIALTPRLAQPPPPPVALDRSTSTNISSLYFWFLCCYCCVMYVNEQPRYRVKQRHGFT